MHQMFQFDFDNLAGFLIAFIPALINLGLLVYILIYLPRTRIVNIFALLTLAMVCWQTEDAVLRIVSTSDIAQAWDSVLSPGWIFLGALCFHFTLLYMRMLPEKYLRFAVVCLYAPGFVLMGLYHSGIYEHNFIHARFWGWLDPHNGHWADELLIWWVSVLGMCSTVMMFLNVYKVRRNTRLHRQSLLISLGIFIPTITGVIAEFILPVLLNERATPVTSTLMTVFSITTSVALRKYKMFSVNDLMSNETAMEVLPVMVINISPDGRINYMNRHAKQKLNILDNTEELTIADIVNDRHPLQWGRLKHFFAKALKGEEVSNVEARIKTDKELMDVLICANPIINNNEVHGVLMSLRDITELKRSYRLVAQNEAQLKIAQQLAKTGSWEWDIVADKVIWSDELHRIFGYKPGQIIINYESYLHLIHPEEKDYVNSIIQKAFVDKKPFSFYHRLIQFGTNEVVHIHSLGNVVTDASGNLIKMNGTAQDVTEIRKKEEQLRQKNEELQKINAELDGFVYSVSHDLRSPLTSILGIIDIAENESKDSNLKEYFHMLRTSVNKLDKFILDILQYSRNARTDIASEPIDFDLFLPELMAHLEVEQRTKDLVVETKINGGIVYSDKNRLSLILNNLISNAIRYSNPNNSPKRVLIEVDARPGTAIIKVTDNGRGIPKELHEKIFDMFFRATSDSIGSGLGLYIVKEAVNKLNGTITVESEPGQGSTFILSIPSLSNAAAEVESKKEMAK